MKSSFTGRTYLKLTGFILILVLFFMFYSDRDSYSLHSKDARPVKTSDVNNIQPSVKKMTPGAACCKGSFSRTAILNSKSDRIDIPSKNK